jgi:hypothetical protein
VYAASRASTVVCPVHAPQSDRIVGVVSDSEATDDQGDVGQDDGMGPEDGDTDQGQDDQGNPTE